MGTAKYPEFANFGEYIYYSYANFQMLFYALSHGLQHYNRTCYMIRAKFYKGYKEGRYNIRDLMDNNVAKLKSDNLHCWYCGCEVSSPNELTIDHIFPRSKGGSNDIDNIFMVCKKCNSSKRDLDLLEWYFEKRKEFPPIHIWAHYLKSIYFYAKEHNLLDKHREELDQIDLPFKIKYIQLKFPQPEFFMSEGLID